MKNDVMLSLEGMKNDVMLSFFTLLMQWTILIKFLVRVPNMQDMIKYYFNWNFQNSVSDELQGSHQLFPHFLVPQ